MTVDERIKEIEAVIKRRSEADWDGWEYGDDDEYDAGFDLQDMEENLGGNGNSFLDGYWHALQELKRGVLVIKADSV